jgi:homoserine dehydrogenase
MTGEGREFGDVLKKAQKKGYAETDPTFDVEGYDTAHKLVILTILGFETYVEQKNFHVEGISKITPDDILFTKEELKSCIKLLAIAKLVDGELEVRVHPTLVPESHLLASINGVFNGVYIVGDIVGPVMMYSPGAGMMPTASAVVGDCMDIIQNMNKPTAYGPKENRVKALKGMADVRSRYYIRLQATDKPGVLHSISGILSDCNVSLESVNQKQTAKGEPVPIFMVTHEALEKKYECSCGQDQRTGVC